MDNPTFVNEEDIQMIIKTKIIMTITGHQIQAGKMRHCLWYAIPQGQHRRYDKDQK